MKNYVILVSLWLLTTLVLSNAFKGLLLSSYVNDRSDLAFKSLNQLINNKSSVDIYIDDSIKFLKNSKNEIPKIILELQKRALKNGSHDSHPSLLYSHSKKLEKLIKGLMVVICNSNVCPLHFLMCQQVKLVIAQQYYHSFTGLKIKKSHSHSKQIAKL